MATQINREIPAATLAKLQNTSVTFASDLDAVNAAQAKYGKADLLRFCTVQLNTGRWIPVFVGTQACTHNVYENFRVIS